VAGAAADVKPGQGRRGPMVRRRLSKPFSIAPVYGTIPAMDREQAIQILRAHVDEIRRHGVVRLALFGSLVRDQDRPGSDIDLLVDIEDERAFSLFDQIGLKHYFEDLLGRPVDVARRQNLKPFLREAILAEAVEIYPQPEPLPASARSQPMPPRSPRQRLEDMRQAILTTQTYTTGRSLADYQADRLLQLAVERNIEILSEASRHLPDDLKARHPQIPWGKVRDIGNVLRHGYELVDHTVIWEIVVEHLPALKAAVTAMIATTEAGSG
jgi:uncharacterized protein with HEPN domain/predicted nucleotidyltransferase